MKGRDLRGSTQRQYCKYFAVGSVVEGSPVESSNQPDARRRTIGYENTGIEKALGNVERRLVLHYFHSISADDFAGATIKMIKKNVELLIGQY